MPETIFTHVASAWQAFAYPRRIPLCAIDFMRFSPVYSKGAEEELKSFFAQSGFKLPGAGEVFRTFESGFIFFNQNPPLVFKVNPKL
jgi:hypothetical protein